MRPKQKQSKVHKSVRCVDCLIDKYPPRELLTLPYRCQRCRKRTP